MLCPADHLSVFCPKALIWYSDIEPMIALGRFYCLAYELLPFWNFVSLSIMILIGCISAHSYCSFWFVPLYTETSLLLSVIGVVLESHIAYHAEARVILKYVLYLDPTLLLITLSHLATYQSLGSSMEEVLLSGFIYLAKYLGYLVGSSPCPSAARGFSGSSWTSWSIKIPG